MAVYTQLSRDAIEALLKQYDCGELLSFDGILQGVENTNYKIETDRNRFILTVFEKRTNADDLPFFFDFMGHLAKSGVYCPTVIHSKTGPAIVKIAGKSAALISFLDGHNIDASMITPDLCLEAGELLARMHIAAQSFDQSRENSMSLQTWKIIFKKIKDKVDDALSVLIEDELKMAEETLAADLPKAVVHADFFPDNVFMRDGHVEGVIDFYFSSTDYLVYDLAMTVNAWCFEKGEFLSDRFDALINGYQSCRPLSEAEKKSFKGMARAAALRILMTREHDWIFHDPAALVKPKDPLEYKRILEFHRDNILFG